jgi:hypothetical protein
MCSAERQLDSTKMKLKDVEGSGNASFEALFRNWTGMTEKNQESLQPG